MTGARSRFILVDLSDTHGGFKAALLNPEVVLYDEDERGKVVPYSPKLTATQRFLWDLYERNIAETVELAGSDPIHVLHNGDLTHGNKRPEQLVTTSIANQILIAQANLEPWLRVKQVKTLRLATGTGWHEFGEGSASVLVADALRRRYPGRDIAASYHGLADYGGFVVDYAHHGPPPGSRVWLRGNVARFYLRDLMMQELLAGNCPPDLVLRAHYHAYIREVLELEGHESTLIVTPSYSFLTDFAHKATRAAHRVSVGQVAFEVVGGKLARIFRQFETLDIRTREQFDG